MLMTIDQAYGWNMGEGRAQRARALAVFVWPRAPWQSLSAASRGLAPLSWATTLPLVVDLMASIHPTTSEAFLEPAAPAQNPRAARDQRWTALMVAAQAGDAVAYQTLLGELRDAISSYLGSRFGDVEWIDDCVQESLLAIHKARHTFVAPKPIAAWVFAIVSNKSIDMFRRRGAGVGKNTEASDQLDDREQLMARSSESAIDAGRALGWLEPKYRKALMLTKLQGYTVEEAASMAGVSHTAMRTRVSRALRMVKRGLERDGI